MDDKGERNSRRQEQIQHRKVVVELKDGALISGELRDVHDAQIQEVTSGGKTELIISAPGISIYRGFADVVFINKEDIAIIHETH